MPDARDDLLDRILTEATTNGLADRSLRDLAAAVGSSHRMLHYHFGSRAGLVGALVQRVESAQRELLVELAAEADGVADLVMTLWYRTAAPEMLPFVRLFFECVAATGGEGLTEPWMDVAAEVAEMIGVELDADELRLAVAVSRGLLIDVLATGDATAATRSMRRFVALWGV
ncbi:MAG: TetR/AcrR family transcriptional regulator [Acidimicrobiales bacterium]